MSELSKWDLNPKRACCICQDTGTYESELGGKLRCMRCCKHVMDNEDLCTCIICGLDPSEELCAIEGFYRLG